MLNDHVLYIFIDNLDQDNLEDQGHITRNLLAGQYIIH